MATSTDFTNDMIANLFLTVRVYVYVCLLATNIIFEFISVLPRPSFLLSVYCSAPSGRYYELQDGYLLNSAEVLVLGLTHVQQTARVASISTLQLFPLAF